jgi:hypothetical protein
MQQKGRVFCPAFPFCRPRSEISRQDNFVYTKTRAAIVLIDMNRQTVRLIVVAVALAVITAIGIYRASTPKLASLVIKLPQPMFVGTREAIRVSNLKKFNPEDRPPFLAPLGTTNVALGKPVFSSDGEPIIGAIEMITDGDKEAADGSYVELGPFLQHVTIDLEARHEIYAVVIWHYHKQPRAYFDVIVQTADDPDFTTNVRTLFNNDTDNSAGLGAGADMHYVESYKGELIDAEGVKARYVRLYSNGNNTDDLNHYIEVEVYGKPA